MNKIANTLDLLPQGETLALYVKRLRELRGLTRTELATLAAVNVSTIARIEGGATGSERPRKEVQERLSTALYLKAASKGESVSHSQTNKVCLKCWVPGSSPDMRWSELDAKFCLKCGEGLKDKCVRCREPILLRGRFCPRCGEKYSNLSISK
jgi:transcriptional regulator with XRE-family HTH domain